MQNKLYKVEGVRGMPIIPPSAGKVRRQIESLLMSVLVDFGYREMRPPLIERSELFIRSIGNSTDIVEKEMYEFTDKKGVPLCLRPEATAGMMRAGIALGIFTSLERLWCLGPMFRYERPQSGRSRQFDQLDVEAVGSSSPFIDAELIWLSSLFWDKLNLKNRPTLQINALGNIETRRSYSADIKSYLNQYRPELDEDSQRRLDSSPLRVLDSKNLKTREILAGAPDISTYWDDETQLHIKEVTLALDRLMINYEINSSLVRGLDYYDKMVFEWVSGELGAQDTVCAGGRYDGLIKQLGGKDTPAVGFAVGMERLMLMLEADENNSHNEESYSKHLLLLAITEKTSLFGVLQQIRHQLPQWIIECDFGAGGLKNKLKRADKKGFYYILIIGDEELKNEQIIFKDMRQGKQETLKLNSLINKLENI